MLASATSVRWIERLITVLALAMAAYHVVLGKWILLPLDQHKNLHIALALILIYLAAAANRQRSGAGSGGLFIGAAAVAAVVGGYIHAIYYDLMDVSLPDLGDTVLGLVLLLLVLDATRRTWGYLMPSLAVAGLLYGYFGAYTPGIFFHGGISFPRLIAYSTTYFRGILGSLTGISAIEVFLFILFGSLLEAAGGLDFFMKVARAAGGRLRSSPAQAAVVSSALMGTINGSIAANVATTGAFTIPTMIRAGYKPEYAGAVEAVASTGGQLMPPVMGVAAFIMAGMTGIPYPMIAKAALFPALVYYLFLVVAVQIRAVKMNLPFAEKTRVDWSAVAREYGLLLLPIVWMVYTLVQNDPVRLAAFNAIIGIIGVVALQKLGRHRTNLRLAAGEFATFLVGGLRRGAVSGAQIAVVVGTLGILVEMFVVTGFAQRLSFALIDLAGGSLVPLLLLTAVTCLLFGMGLPTSAVYLLVAILGAPALVEHGIPILAAHLFVFYFGLMSAVTPPVAVGALVASGIAKSDYLRTALHALKLALPGFVLPFFFIYRPAILWTEGTPLWLVLSEFAAALVGLVALTAVVEGFLISRLRIWHGALLLVSSALSLLPGLVSSAVGLVLFLLVLAVQYRAQAPQRAAAPAA